jgi:hypothetical protein
MEYLEGKIKEIELNDKKQISFNSVGELND